MRRHKYADARSKRIDFWLGFMAWFVGNAIGLFVLSRVSFEGQQLAQGLLVLANIATLIALSVTRSFAALGLLTAFAVMFGAVVLGGIFFTLGDFVAAGGGGGAVAVWALGAVLIPILAIVALVFIHRGIK